LKAEINFNEVIGNILSKDTVIINLTNYLVVGQNNFAFFFSQNVKLFFLRPLQSHTFSIKSFKLLI